MPRGPDARQIGDATITVREVGVATGRFRIVDLPQSQRDVRSSGAALSPERIDPPGAVDATDAVGPLVATTVVGRHQTVAVCVWAEGPNALTLAKGLVEHAIGASTGGNVADGLRAA